MLTSRTMSALKPEQLRWTCDTDELGPDDPHVANEATIGQQRGVDAITFGLALEQEGFNVFVAGPPGSGRTTTVQTLVARATSRRPAASDWCYVHNPWCFRTLRAYQSIRESQ
jgi:Cdc6-like AAA superfamily ATPase